MSKEAIYEKFSQAVINGDEELAEKTAHEAVEAKLDASEAIVEGLSKGMATVGELFENQEYFLAEVILAADAFQAGVKILKPHIKVDADAPKYKAIIATVQGDTHDIGKNIVGIMLGAAGFDVIDLGRDVPPKVVVERVKQEGKALVGLSALMTTSMVSIRKTLELLRAEGVRDQAKVIIGGASVSQRFADEIGADGYSVDGPSAVRLARRLVENF